MAKETERQPKRLESGPKTDSADRSAKVPAARDAAGGVITFRVTADELAQLDELRQRMRLESVNVTARALLLGCLLPSARLIDVSAQLERLVDAIEGQSESPRGRGVGDEQIRLQLARAFATLFINLNGPATASVNPSEKEAKEARLEKARRAFRQCFDLDE